MNKWCCRCKEDSFPIASENMPMRMGYLYPRKQLYKYVKGKKIKNHFQVRTQTGDYLCGNCYFDLLDLIEEEIK